MPELPEVEIVKQSLINTVKNKQIIAVKVNNRKLRIFVEKNFEKKLKNKKIINVSRFAKYIIIHLDSSDFIVIHFGMSGTLHILKKNSKFNRSNLSFYNSKYLPQKHNHIIFRFKNFKIIYNDPRRFGFIKIFKSREILNNFIKKYGLEPLDKKFNLFYLQKIFRNRIKSVKNILLDQNLISGIGNIYASEILFYSKINPRSEGKTLGIHSLKKIIKFSKFVLKKAINKGGSSIRDFRTLENSIGKYQHEFMVYDRKNENCRSAGCNKKITKIIISNRSTFYCQNCQK